MKGPVLFNVYLHPCCHGEVRSLPEIKALVLPDVLHYPNDLQRQHVLPQICEAERETRRRITMRWVLAASLLWSTPWCIMEQQSFQRQKSSRSQKLQNAQAAEVKCEIPAMCCSFWNLFKEHWYGCVGLSWHTLQAYTELCCMLSKSASVCVCVCVLRQGGRERRSVRTYHLHFWRWFRCSETAAPTSYLGFPS